MRVARLKSFKRPTPLCRRLSAARATRTRPPFRTSKTIHSVLLEDTSLPSRPTFDTVDQIRTSSSRDPDKASLSDGLAICLIGFSRTMYDSEYEEEVRKRAIMSEVLPDEVMWAAWAKNEAPLRQGRGWYPALDRHFLELLVISEIHCLSHPIHLSQNQATAERIHRHASRVRRVACERIGAERLHAYCERVKEAFEAYVPGGWTGTPASARVFATSEESVESAESESEEDEDGEGEGYGGGDGTGESDGRGRSKTRGLGSVVRAESPKERTGGPTTLEASEEGTMSKDCCDPFADGKDVESGLQGIVVTTHSKVAPALLDLEFESDLLTVDLDNVYEDDESVLTSDKSDDGLDMDFDLESSLPRSTTFPAAETIIQAHAKASPVTMSGESPVTA